MKHLYKKLFIVTLFISRLSLAGGESSGGGGAAVCRDNNKKIVSAQLLDLYEGVVRFNYNIPQINQSAKDQILNALSKINDPLLKQLIKQTIVQIIDSVTFLPLGVGMAPTTDLGEEYAVVVPEGCAIEPIGFYESDGTLKISRSVYNALSETNRAAFFMHESIYKIARDLSYKKDSSESRKTVAAVFSTSSTEANSQIDQLYYNPNEYSLKYWNYHQIGTLNLNNPTGPVLLNINVNSSSVSSITAKCSSNRKTTYQIIENQSSVSFKLDTKNCMAYSFYISPENSEILSGEIFGNFSIKDTTGNLLTNGNLSYATKGTQKDLFTNYFIPIFHLYKEIKGIPKP